MKPAESWSSTWTPAPRTDRWKIPSDGRNTALRRCTACGAAAPGASPGQRSALPGAGLTMHPTRGEHPARPPDEGAAGHISHLLQACQDGAGS